MAGVLSGALNVSKVSERAVAVGCGRVLLCHSPKPVGERRLCLPGDERDKMGGRGFECPFQYPPCMEVKKTNTMFFYDV